MRGQAAVGKGKREMNKRKNIQKVSAPCPLFTTFCIYSFLFAACASGPRSNIAELENKGTIAGVRAPQWVRVYLDKGLTALQAQYPDRYCIVGEESGVNRQFVLAWADQASAQQRIGALLRTNIAARFEAAITGQSGGDAAAVYKQEINNIASVVINVSYSEAQREGDWWSLRRLYDPDDKELYSDVYTAWVLYTVPKTEMNRQIALALQTAASRDSGLYDLTIALARDILLQGYDENAVQSAAVILQTASDNYDPPDSVVALALNEINLIAEYDIGRDVAASILSNYRMYNAHPVLTNYINNICQALVINSPRPAAFNGYNAAILDSGEINAFASPGGHVFVTRGLVAAAKSEDALAAVLAHEIAHIQLGHGIRAIRSNRDLEDWFSQFTMSGAQTIMGRLNNGFSHTQEFDADITAMSLLAAAGYNPQALPAMLRELEKLQGGSIGGFNPPHPSPSSRYVNAAVAAARYAGRPDNSARRQGRFNAIVQ
jgi:hypothetical protein